MLFAPRISGKPLADLCHRLAVSLAAGVDLRKTWQREVERASWRTRDALAQVQREIERGQPLAAALDKTGSLFPKLVRQMIGVGEKTGQTVEVLHKLAHHYQVRHNLSRAFLAALAWPLMQLVAAVLIVGLLIWILGMIDAQDLDGNPIDPLGFGLVGTPGLILYIVIVLACVVACSGLVVALRRGLFWMAPLQRTLTGLPGIGAAIQKICLAHVSWTLHLLLNVEMDMRQMIPLVLRSTGNDYYMQHSKKMVADVAAGQPLHLAFANTGAFPPAFLDALAVAEESGQISESMARLTKQYEAEAESAMKWLAVLTGAVVWLMVAALIIVMIFRLYSVFVLNRYEELLDM